MRLVSRAQWGARPVRAGWNVRFGNDFRGCAVHWSAGRAQANHAQCAATMRGIDGIDVNVQPAFMYNAAVCVHGYVFEGRPAGMINGANGGNFNGQFAAICALCGPHDAQPAALHQAIRDAVGWVRSWAPRPIGQIVGHRDLVSTQCPGDQLHALVRSGAFNPGGPTPPPPPPSGRDWLSMVSEAQLRTIVQAECNRVVMTWWRSAEVEQRIVNAGVRNLNRQEFIDRVMLGAHDANRDWWRSPEVEQRLINAARHAVQEQAQGRAVDADEADDAVPLLADPEVATPEPEPIPEDDDPERNLPHEDEGKS